MAITQPAWQQLLHTLDQSESNQDRFVIYQKLKSELCEVASYCSIGDIQDDFTNVIAVICGDIRCQNEELVLCALYTMGLFLHHKHLVSSLPCNQMAEILRSLCGIVVETTNKNICTRALWCLAKQNLPVAAIEAELPRILSTIEHGQCRKKLQSMTVEHEALNAVIRMLEVVPASMTDHTRVWAKLVYPLLVHGAHKVRCRAMVAMEMSMTTMVQHQTEFSKNLEEDLKTLLIGELQKLMSSGEERYALKVWGIYIKLLGKALHRSHLINPLLRIPQQGFRHSDSGVKCVTFTAWKTLIDNFALNPDIIADHSRVKLIMQVFIRLGAKDESLAVAKLDAWWHFLSKLGSKLPFYFEQVCVPLLQFCTGDMLISVGFTPAKSGGRTPTHNKLVERTGFASPGTPQMNFTVNPGSSIPTFPVIKRKGFEVIAHFLGAQQEGADPSILPLSLGALEQTVITGVSLFVKHASVLISTVREIIVSEGKNIPEDLLLSVWFALMAHIKNVLDTATKRDGVDVLVCFLDNLRQIVDSNSTAVNSVLKLLQAVLCLPARALVSAAYSAGGTTEVMQNCPALVLMDLLLHRSIVDSDFSHQRFFTLLKKLVSCGFSHGCSALDFSQVALQLVDRAAMYTQNKDTLWEMWGVITQPMKEHIAKTSEVNQGDHMEHNFSCLYSALLFPLHHLLPCHMLQSIQKSLLKMWTELCNTFARLAVMVTNAEANVWVEELCSKICDSLPAIDYQGVQCVDGLLQVCLVVIGNVDFSVPVSHGLLSTKCHHFGSGTMLFGRWKQKPLGSLHSLVCLVAQILGTLCELIQQHRSDSEAKKMFQSPALNAVHALNSLFSNITISVAIADLIARLAPGMAALYTIAAKRSNQRVFSAPVLEKLDSLWMTFASMMKTRFTGIHDSELLAQIAPLFEVGFTYPRKLVKNQTISLWNATFGQGAPLKYPDTLKPVIVRMQRSVTLLLPGWDTTNMTADDDVTFSEMTQLIGPASVHQEESQGVSPNIIGFPSPRKGCGSFLQKATLPHLIKSPLSSRPSPCRQKTATARRKLPLIDDRHKEAECVVIPELPKKKQVLTEHQKEMKRERRVLPVMYNNLDASQDTQLDSLDDTQLDRIDDTQMTCLESENKTCDVMPKCERVDPPVAPSRNPREMALKVTGGTKVTVDVTEKVTVEDIDDKQRDRRKKIRWALNKNSNIPVEQLKDEDGDMQKGLVTEMYPVEPKGEQKVTSRIQLPTGAVTIDTDIEDISTMSSRNKECPQEDGKVTSEEVKTDSQDMQPRSENTNKVEVRTLVRRTRSFTRVSCASSLKVCSPSELSSSPPKATSPRKRLSSPAKTASPKKQLLSPRKTAGRCHSSRSPMKSCHLHEKLDQWLTMSCHNKTTCNQNLPLSSAQSVSDNSGEEVNVKDMMGKTETTVTLSVNEHVGGLKRAVEECNKVSPLTDDIGVSSRLPIVQLHKLSAQEILSFSPKKRQTKTEEHPESAEVCESRIVDRSRDSDDSDSEESTSSEDLFAPSQSSAGIKSSYGVRHAGESAVLRGGLCFDMSEQEGNLEKLKTGESLSCDTRTGSCGNGTSDRLPETVQLTNNSTGAQTSDVIKDTVVIGSDMGSRSRQRRPPGWLKDMECSSMSPRSREKALQQTARHSPLVVKSVSTTLRDCSQGNTAGQLSKTSLNFADSNHVNAVDDHVSCLKSRSTDGEKSDQSVELDSVAMETEMTVAVTENTMDDIDRETTQGDVGEKSAADVNEDTPQSAPSGIGCEKRSSSKWAKRINASSGKRRKIKAKVLNTIFSKQCNLDVESSDEENVPLSLLSEMADGAALDKENTDDLPFSQIVQTVSTENRSPDTQFNSAKCELVVSQDSSLQFTVREDVGSTEETPSDTADYNLALVSSVVTIVSPDVTTKSKQPPVKRSKKQSAIKKLDSQLGIDMSSPVRKCLRSNKGAKLFKPRSISSLDSSRRKHQRSVSRKRKRESGNHHDWSLSVEDKSKAAVCHQECEEISECVPQDGSTGEKVVVSVDAETLVTCNQKDNTCNQKDNTCNQKDNTCNQKDNTCNQKDNTCKQKDNTCKQKDNTCNQKDNTCSQEKKPCNQGKKPCDQENNPCDQENNPCDQEKKPCDQEKKPCDQGKNPCDQENNPCDQENNPCDQEKNPCDQEKNPCDQENNPCDQENNPCDQENNPCDQENNPCDMTTSEKGTTKCEMSAKEKSADSKETEVDKKTSFAMSRASLILHRAQLMMRGNKPLPGNSESVVMVKDGDSAKPELPRCVGILKPARLDECNPIERGDQSPPSQFRPVQLPCVYSPAASPSAGILKKQRLSSDMPNELPSPKSPSKKRRRVSFADSVQTVEFRRHATRARPAKRDYLRGVNRCLDIPRRKRSPLTTLRLWGTRNKSPADSASTREASFSDTEPLNNVDPIFPNLVDCDTRVECVLPQLTSTLWVRGLEQLVHAKNLRTIGDLSALTEDEVNNLPIRSPKVLTMRRALQSILESKTLTSAKSVEVALKERDSEKEVEPLVLTASPDKVNSSSEVKVMSIQDEGREKELGLTSPTKGELPCVEEELAKLSPIKKGDLDSSLECLLPQETSGGITDESETVMLLEPEHDMEIFNSNDTVLNSTNDAEVIMMDISELKERLSSTDLTQLGSLDLVKVHEQLNSMMGLVVLALKAKCQTSPQRAGKNQ